MARKKRPQQQRNLPVPARQQPELSSLSTLAAKLLALAVEQRRALESIDNVGAGQLSHIAQARKIAAAALATDYDALVNEAKDLGIDATTPAMAPETGDASR